mgnify:CR=1 FL=1
MHMYLYCTNSRVLILKKQFVFQCLFILLKNGKIVAIFNNYTILSTYPIQFKCLINAIDDLNGQ